MSFRIEKNEALPSALGRITAEELAFAQSELGRDEPSEAMHNTRKSLKRLRALLRTLRVALPYDALRGENRRLAAAGRKIAPLRDAHVRRVTLAKLGAAGGEAAKKIEADLHRREQSCVRQIPALRREVRAMLSASRKTLAALPMNSATPESLAAGCKRIYKRGRAAFKAVRHNPTPESLHEWRKQAKILRHAFELIQCLSPKDAAAMPKATAQLCQTLGDDHDLFLVQEVLRRGAGARPGREIRRLSKRISSKRLRLQARAFQLGRKIYAGEPGAFRRRLQDGLARIPSPP